MRSVATRRRAATRVLLGIVLVMALGAVALTLRRHSPLPAELGGVLPGPGGITIKGFRHASYDAAGLQVLLVTAEEVVVEPARFGIFRLGFASELTARDARVDALLRADAERSAALDLAKTIQAITGPGQRRGRTVARAVVRGIVLHLHDEGGDWVEITAGRCETQTRDPRLVELRGGVHVRAAAIDVAFDGVDYDTASHAFVLPGRARRDESRRAALAAANAALGRLL